MLLCSINLQKINNKTVLIFYLKDGFRHEMLYCVVTHKRRKSLENKTK